LRHEDIQIISQVFNKKGRSNISAKDIFDIIDFYCKSDDKAELECKYIVSKAENCGMNIDRYV